MNKLKRRRHRTIYEINTNHDSLPFDYDPSDSEDSDSDSEDDKKVPALPLKKRKASEGRGQQKRRKSRRTLPTRSSSRLKDKSSASSLAMVDDEKKEVKATEDEKKEEKATEDENPYQKQYRNKPSNSRHLGARNNDNSSVKKVSNASKKGPKASKTKVLPPKTKESTGSVKPAPTRKNGKNKRPVNSRPRTVSSMKDRTVRGNFECCAKHTAKLQCSTTIENEKARKIHPKSQHFMYTYDEVLERPHNAEMGIQVRDEPLHIFLTPEGVNTKEFGKRLKKVAEEMTKNSGKGYRLTNDHEEYTELVFGSLLHPRKTKEC
eukprot:CAMPEP_0116137230 /NCGR_PEP_ID=MMETSP0329-20121206/12143_1 /TAXON_ID=697910 /ORGANISM="Pseudo-nitzschia arenysensis, Strain B593" /LENGTH=319 /DNA_ID=CAMNT_0003632143 /DNA_START=28 /DNA_END=987 /DNA_ORIENTATION=+